MASRIFDHKNLTSKISYLTSCSYTLRIHARSLAILNPMITTLTGKNSHALQASLQKLVEDARKQSGEFGVERFDASETDVDILLQAVQSLPFLSSRKLVIIKDIQSNAQILERIAELVDRTAESVDVVIVEPKLDKRKNSYKLLKKLTTMQEFTELNPRDLPRRIVQEVKSLGGSISLSDASYLMDRIGSNQQRLMREIEKLLIRSVDIDRHAIDEMTDQSVQSTIFSLLDAAFAGNRKQAIEIYREQRSARVDPQYILAMLTWQLTGLSLAVFSKTKSEQELVSVGQSPFTARKSLNLARNVSKADIRRMVKDLSELDAKIKTSADADSALELYLLSLK